MPKPPDCWFRTRQLTVEAEMLERMVAPFKTRERCSRDSVSLAGALSLTMLDADNSNGPYNSDFPENSAP